MCTIYATFGNKSWDSESCTWKDNFHAGDHLFLENYVAIHNKLQRCCWKLIIVWPLCIRSQTSQHCTSKIWLYWKWKRGWLRIVTASDCYESRRAVLSTLKLCFRIFATCQLYINLGGTWQTLRVNSARLSLQSSSRPWDKRLVPQIFVGLELFMTFLAISSRDHL